MKETRFFYDPDLAGQLPEEEAKHAVRVLRMAEGDMLNLMDGRGSFCVAQITAAGNHRCAYTIVERETQMPDWLGHLHLAMAPTKLNDRVEWFAEKATEIGFNELSFVRCQYSERKEIKQERVEKIVVSAMKQSHKAWKTQLNEMMDFRKFVSQERKGQKCICHCYADADVGCRQPRAFLLDALKQGEDATVLIGPEGDFSVEEVKLAMANGYQSVSLGRSRLRTETAALVAVHLMQLKNQRR